MPPSSKRTTLLYNHDSNSSETAEAGVGVAPARSLMIVVGFLLVFATIAAKEGLSIRSSLGLGRSNSTAYPKNNAAMVREHEYASANRIENEKESKSKSKSKRVRGGPKIGAALAYRKQARALPRPL